VVVFGALAAGIAFLAATVPGPITQVSTVKCRIRKLSYSIPLAYGNIVCIQYNDYSIVTNDELMFWLRNATNITSLVG